MNTVYGLFTFKLVTTDDQQVKKIELCRIHLLERDTRFEK